MASTINADNGVVSGSSGVKTTADTSGVLALQSNGTTGLTLNTSLALGVGSGNSTGTSGQILTSAGSSAAPAWATLPPSVPTITAYTNQSADVTLTSADANSILTFTLANDITVNLPNATTLTSGRNFTIKNNSQTYGIYVKDGAGNFLFSIPSGTSQDCWATTIATSAGTWSTSNLPVPYLSGATTQVSVSALKMASPNTMSAISTTQAVELYITGYYGTVNLYAVVVTNTGGTVSYGTPALVTTGLYYPYAAVCALSATDGVILYYKPGSNTKLDFSGVVFTVSGTTISFGTENTVFNTGSYGNTTEANVSATMLTSSTACVLIGAYPGYPTTAYVLTVSGSTITVGSGTTLTSLPSNWNTAFPSICALTATLCVVGYVRADSYMCNQSLAISGTTITRGTENTVGWSPNRVSVVPATATTFVSVYTSGTSAYASAGTISGGTITYGAYAASPQLSQITLPAAAASSATSFVVYGRNNSSAGTVSQQLSISGTTITWGAASYTSSTIAVDSAAPPNFVGLKAPGVGPGSTTSFLGQFTSTTANAGLGVYNQNLTLSGSVITSNAVAVAYSTSASPANYISTQRMAALSSSQFVTLEVGASTSGTSTLIAKLWSVSTSTSTLQSTVSIANGVYVGGGSYSQPYSVIALSATSLMVLYCTSTPSTCYAVIVSISGSTLTVNTPVTVYSGAGSNNYVGAALSSTSAIVSMGDRVYVLTVSGTTITVGSFVASAFAITNMVALSPTLAIGAYVDSSSSYVNVRVFTVSGSTPTAAGGTSNIGYGSISDAPTLAALSSSQAVLTFKGTPSSVTTANLNSMVVLNFTNPSTPTWGAITTVSTSTMFNLSYGAFATSVVAMSSTNGLLFGSFNAFTGGAAMSLMGSWRVVGNNILFTQDALNPVKPAFPNYNSSAIALQAPAVATPNAGEAVVSLFESTSTGLTNVGTVTLRKYSLSGSVN